MTMEQNRAEPAAEAVEKTVLNNLPVMALQCRHDGSRTLLWVSSGGQDLTGYSAAELNTGTFAYVDLIIPADRAEVCQKISRAVLEQRPYDLVYRLRTAAGQEHWVREVGQAIYNPQRSAESLTAIVSDYEEQTVKLGEDAEQLKIVEERNRLARELHDSVTQSLYSVTLFAEAGRRMLNQGDTKQAAVYLADVNQTGRQALKEMRLLVHRLRPSILTQEGLVRAVQHRLNAVEGRAGVVNQLIIEGNLNLNPRLEEALYHIIQEALNNALKHSVATEVVVILRDAGDGALDLQVIDNGRGFDPEKVQGMGGLGLTSMRERAEMFGGKMTCTSAPGEGTTIRVHFRAPAPSLDPAEEII